VPGVTQTVYLTWPGFTSIYPNSGGILGADFVQMFTYPGWAREPGCVPGVTSLAGPASRPCPFFVLNGERALTGAWEQAECLAALIPAVAQKGEGGQVDRQQPKPEPLTVLGRADGLRRIEATARFSTLTRDESRRKGRTPRPH